MPLIFLRLSLALLVGALAIAFVDDAPWTLDDAAAHADRFNDPDAWRRDWIGGDLAAQRAREDTAEWMPFSWTVFPAPPLGASGRTTAGVAITPLELPEPLVGVMSFANIADDGDDLAYDERPVRPVFALVARGDSPLRLMDEQAIHRSHPHIVYQATFASDDGEIDAVVLDHANGTRVAIVNGRVLELSVGNVIVVRQRGNGSVEIFQHRALLEPATRAEVAVEIGKRLGDPAAQPFWR